MQLNYLTKLLGIQGYYIANLKMEERRHQSEIHLWWKSHNFGIEEAETKL